MTTDEVYSSSQERIQTDRSVGLDLELDELLHKSAEQNQVAFRELFGRTRVSLFAVQLRILKDRSLAENALKESYIKIWNNASHYHSGLGTPLTWMMAIAREQALDTLRKRRTSENSDKTFIPDSPVFDGNNIDTSAQSPLELLADSAALKLCLGKVEENPRKCILKAYCEGWSHAQLSAQLGSPLGTVKSWTRRGLITLRESLNELA